MRRANYKQTELIPVTKSESQIQAEIVNYMIDKNFLTIRINSLCTRINNRFLRSYYIQNNGKSTDLPDLLCLKNSKGYLIECKSAKGKLSDGQKQFIELAAKHGIEVITARSVSDVENYLERANNEN